MLIFRFLALTELGAEEVGTVQLVEGIVAQFLTDFQRHIRSQTKRIRHYTGLVPIPQPSDDVNDPLDWPKWKKLPAILTSPLGFWVESVPELYSRWKSSTKI
jgi:hypothetical protein